MNQIDLMIRLRNAVAFARITDEHNINAAFAQRAVILLGLGNRHAAILLAVRDHQGRLYAVYVSHRRILLVKLPGGPGQPLESILHQSWDVALTVEAVPIADPRVSNRRFKTIRLCDDPECHK